MTAGGQSWIWALNVGLVKPGPTAHTAFAQSPVLINLVVGLEKNISRQWRAGAQLQASSQRYQIPGNDVKALTEQQMIGLLKIQRLDENRVVSLGFTEDLLYNNSEDFSLIGQWLEHFR